MHNILQDKCENQTKITDVKSLEQIWLRSTKNLEPISSVMAAEPCRLSPNACGRTRPLRPTRKTLCLIFLISPRRDFFFSCKGCFLVVRLLQAVEALGLRPGGRAAALRALDPQAMHLTHAAGIIREV